MNRRDLADKQRRSPRVQRRDVLMLDRHAGGRVLYSALVQQRADVVAGAFKFENASVSDADPALWYIRDIEIERGRFFGSGEAARAVPVAVLGADVADTLFPGRDPLGAGVRIGGRRFEVVGLQRRAGSFGGVSLDRYVWIPLSAYQRVYGTEASLQVFARRAVGATRGRLIGEVLGESTWVSLLGGTAGLLAAWCLTGGLARILGLTLQLQPSTLIWSFAASLLSGLLAGWYPARRASRIPIIAALRME